VKSASLVNKRGEAIHPVPYKRGKADAINLTIRNRPQLVAGNGSGDIEMLELAERAAIVINPSAELEQLAKKKDWLIQDLP